jgi:hypothetical protein
VTGRDERAWPADLAGTLAGVDEFLRTPAGQAALEDFYAARGSIAAGFEAGNLIDAVSFTALWLRGRATPQTRRP